MNRPGRPFRRIRRKSRKLPGWHVPALVERLEDRVMLSSVTIETGPPLYVENVGDVTDPGEPIHIAPDVTVDAGVAAPSGFSDDFSNGIDPQSWTSGGATAVVDPADSGNTLVGLENGQFLTLNTIDVAGGTEVTLQFTFRPKAGTGMNQLDSLGLFLRLGNGPLQQFDTYSTTDAGTITVPLTVTSADEDPVTGEVDFQVIFLGNTLQSSPLNPKTWFVDDVSVTTNAPTGGGTVNGATVTLADFDPATETIAYTIPANSGISLDANASGNGTFVFTGQASAGDYESLFESFTYETTEEDPGVAYSTSATPSSDDNGLRTFTFTINPGTADEDSAVSEVTVQSVNDAPTNVGFTLDSSTINENGEVELTLNFSDLESTDTHTVTIDWGDDTGDQVIVLPTGDRTLQVSHQYLDDSGTGTFDIEVSVGDGTATVGAVSQSVTVKNLAPEITEASIVTTPGGGYLLPGDSFSISGDFTDVGTLDDHEITIAWGDGSQNTTVVTGNSFAGTHTFTKAGIFDVVVTVDDQDGGVDTFTTRVLVTGVDLNGTALQIVGDDTRNQVLVLRKHGEYRVYSDLDGVRTFDEADVTHIEILTGGDRDHVVVSRHVEIPVVVNAGDGNDVVIGGSGNDVISGGAGNDILFGRGGEDVLLGGDGNDKLFGGRGTDLLVGGDDSDLVFGQHGEDLLIGGSTVFDDDAALVQPPEQIELATILDTWVHGTEAEQQDLADDGIVLDETTVLDDGDFDLLIGGSGDDTAWLFSGDFFCGGRGDDTVA